MVNLTAVRSRLEQVFTPEQADAIVEVHVAMHDELVTRQDFSELKAVVQRLADAEERTTRKIERLTEDVQRLTEGQQRLTEGQQRLAEAQQRTEWAVRDLAKQVGGLAATAGGNLESYALERIPEVLAERFGFVTESCGTEQLRVQGKDHEFDAVVRGTIDGRPVVVLCEVKTNITEAEVRQFLRVVDRLRPVLGADDVRPLFFGYRAAVVTQKLIASGGGWLAFPKGIVMAA